MGPSRSGPARDDDRASRRDGGEAMATLESDPRAASAVESPPVGARSAGARVWLLRVGIGALTVLVLLGVIARVVGLVQEGLPEGDDFTPYWDGARAIAAGQSP